MRDAVGSHLAKRVRTLITASVNGQSYESVGPLAIDIWKYQVQRDTVAERLVDGPVVTWQDIPAVPVALFKQLHVGTIPRDEAPVVFRTSGTTHTGRGVHAMASPDLYEYNANAWAARYLGEVPAEHVALLSDPARVPDASLSHMVSNMRDICSVGETTWHIHHGVLQRQALNDRIATLTSPCFIASTAFALAEWLDGECQVPPENSLLMVTGGFKGRVHKLDGDQLLSIAQRRLGCRVVTEYGMTELSSQLWGQPGGPFTPPPWLLPTAADPITGVDLLPETVGQLRFLDLCNLDSAVRIETLDQGIVHADGRVTLHGRLPGAPARGCSLTIEDAWEAR
ncbi:MAG: hypothetical protein ACJAZO_001799 [Myxococcota bacterium]|jgi:hypothetical protein